MATEVYIEIYNHPGVFAIVDEQDRGLASHLWYLDKGYARRTVLGSGGQHIRMHREILGISEADMHVDHINRNRLDNRRGNLRVVSRFENAQNRTANASSKARVRGVAWHRNSGKWQAEVQHNNQRIYLGLHETAEAAGMVAMAKRRELGEGSFNV